MWEVIEVETTSNAAEEFASSFVPPEFRPQEPGALPGPLSAPSGKTADVHSKLNACTRRTQCCGRIVCSASRGASRDMVAPAGWARGVACKLGGPSRRLVRHARPYVRLLQIYFLRSRQAETRRGTSAY